MVLESCTMNMCVVVCYGRGSSSSGKNLGRIEFSLVVLFQTVKPLAPLPAESEDLVKQTLGLTNSRRPFLVGLLLGGAVMCFCTVVAGMTLAQAGRGTGHGPFGVQGALK